MTTTPAERHPAVTAVLRFFEHGHLPAGPIKEEARAYAEFSSALADRHGSDPELTVALRKLLESKDAAVRCAVIEEKTRRASDAPIVNPSEFQ